jgi:hypothetical protein
MWLMLTTYVGYAREGACRPTEQLMQNPCHIRTCKFRATWPGVTTLTPGVDKLWITWETGVVCHFYHTYIYSQPSQVSDHFGRRSAGCPHPLSTAGDILWITRSEEQNPCHMGVGGKIRGLPTAYIPPCTIFAPWDVGVST